MTAINLTPQATGSVMVTVTGAPAGAVAITRNDANGLGTVRQLEGQVTIGGTLNVTDYEAALVGPLTYTARDALGVVVSGTDTLEGVADGTPRLGVPVRPQLGAPVGIVLGLSGSRASTGTVHTVVDRPDPVPTLAPLRLRAGRMELWAADYADGRALEAIYDRGEVVQLRQGTHPGMDLYHVAERTSLDPLGRTVMGWRWALSVDYIEVGRPTGPRLGDAGWTLADVAAGDAGATLLELRNSYVDLTDFLAGPPS